jgi:hypothetical protein
VAGAGPGKGIGKYGEAHTIAVSPRDEIFVADTLNWRVQKYVRGRGVAQWIASAAWTHHTFRFGFQFQTARRHCEER